MKKLIFLAMILLASPLLRDGSVNSQTANEPGSGNCLSFDGVNDYIRVPNSPSLQITGNISCEMWVNGSGAAPLDCWLVTKPSYGLVYSGAGGSFGHTIYWAVAGYPVLYSTTLFNDNKWHYVVGTHDGSMMRIYVDGVLENSQATGSHGIDTGDLLLGTRSDFAAYAKVFLDEVRIWNRALTQTEIQQNMCQKLADCADPNLVGYWRFDEGTDNTCTGGQDVCDASCNGNNGVKF